MDKPIGDRVPFSPGVRVWPKLGWQGPWVVVEDVGENGPVWLWEPYTFAEDVLDKRPGVSFRVPPAVLTNRRPPHRSIWFMVKVLGLVVIGCLLGSL